VPPPAAGDTTAAQLPEQHDPAAAGDVKALTALAEQHEKTDQAASPA
jgi:hypothetical protein